MSSFFDNGPVLYDDGDKGAATRKPKPHVVTWRQGGVVRLERFGDEARAVEFRDKLNANGGQTPAPNPNAAPDLMADLKAATERIKKENR